MNSGEFSEMDPYEEVAQQGQVHPLSPAYIPDPMVLDEHVPVYVPEPEHPEYHAPSDDDIQVEDDDKDPEEDPSEEHELEDDNEDPKEDPNDEHELEDFDETELFEEEEIVVTPPPPRRHGARISYNFVDTVEAGQGLIRSPGHDTWTIARAADRVEDVSYVRALQASEHRMVTSIEEVNLRVSYQAQVRRQESANFYTQLLDAQTDRRDIRLKIDVVRESSAAAARAPRSQYNFVDTVEAGQGLIRSLGHDTRTIARATDRAEDVGYLLDVQTDHRDIILEIDVVRGQRTAYETELQERKANDSPRNNQQQPHKKQNVARAYTAGPGEKKVYIGDLPLCTKCNYHHTGQCEPKCGKCKRYGHATTDCRVNTNNNNNNNNNKNQKVRACYESGNTGHIKKNFLKLKNHGNGSENGAAQGRVYALGGRDASPDSNVITGTFLLNNRYAKILFNTGVDRSFVSTTFSALIDITPTA
nr:hypothetical protein [Tanacetum cinerariifolium]